jgi:hypothetical protein
MLEAIATGQWPAPANTEAAEEQKKPVASGAIMMCAVCFGGRRAKLQLRSGQFMARVIVSTNFGTDLADGKIDLRGGAALSAGRMFGELHVLPDVGRSRSCRPLELEGIEPDEMSLRKSTRT